MRHALLTAALLVCAACDEPETPARTDGATAVTLDELAEAAALAANGSRYTAKVGHTRRIEPVDGPAPAGDTGDRVAVIMFRREGAECEVGDLTDPARRVHRANVEHRCTAPTVCTRVHCVGETKAWMLVGVQGDMADWMETTQQPPSLIPTSVRDVALGE